MDSDLSEEQEVREEEGGFHDTMGFNKVQELCSQDMLLSYLHQPHLKFPVAL